MDEWMFGDSRPCDVSTRIGTRNHATLSQGLRGELSERRFVVRTESRKMYESVLECC